MSFHISKIHFDIFIHSYAPSIATGFPIHSIFRNPPHGGCAGGRIGTRFLRPRGTSPLKGGQPRGNPGV